MPLRSRCDVLSLLLSLDNSQTTAGAPDSLAAFPKQLKLSVRGQV
jgi:hypothetical protein